MPGQGDEALRRAHRQDQGLPGGAPSGGGDGHGGRGGRDPKPLPAGAPGRPDGGGGDPGGHVLRGALRPDSPHVLRPEGQRTEALRPGPGGKDGGAKGQAGGNLLHLHRGDRPAPGDHDGGVLQGHLHSDALQRHRQPPGNRGLHGGPDQDPLRRFHSGDRPHPGAD